ncbi:uncharacterized protein LOC130013669 [Patella vulgata]|uniref:uncharacterized protein LOC130013669 n=1 Tax=Patella vulgata TaxID=6465 RepID=UPI0024A7AE70|nr:uncharacterized protein LOC130013669 [Patella vulgata]
MRKTDDKDNEETKRTQDNQESQRTKEQQENQDTQKNKNKKQKNIPKNKGTQRTRGKLYLYVPVNAEEIENAETKIIMMFQKQYFDNEIKTLKSNEEQETKDSKLNKSSLYRLDPFLDGKGILRVGGRIKHAKVPGVAKHPIIIPKKGHVTNLIICHHHNRIQHQGRGITHHEIRSAGYWIIDGSSCVSYHISKCVKCRKLRGITQSQKMADLPEDRLEPSPPFNYCSIDFFGPFVVKDRRSALKRYGVLFTCNVSRAIHLEIANDMSADSFINAYRRFVGRRGPIRQLQSDQGSNFVGARTELKIALQEMNQEKIRQELLKDGCDWYEIRMNVPYSSHMGGVWERQIRTVRSILSALMDQHSSQLDDECLRMFMVEAESIVNNRPFTTISTDPDQPITPNHILTSKTKILLPPPGVFQRNDVYLRKRWRKVQYIANEFWNSWRKSYLHNLQERQKWSRSQKNLQVNDIVIIKSDNEPRNHWRLARIDEVYSEDDGLVRKVKLQMADSSLDCYGKRVKPVQYLERPVHKLVLLLMKLKTKGIPIEEP